MSTEKNLTSIIEKSDQKKIYIPVPHGELVDKITILEIKSEKIEDEKKASNVKKELAQLQGIYHDVLPPSSQLNQLKKRLYETNLRLWEIEDRIRSHEKHQDFDSEFIHLARSVYKQNDQRALLKRQINELLGSELVEEKSYVNYE